MIRKNRNFGHSGIITALLLILLLSLRFGYLVPQVTFQTNHFSYASHTSTTRLSPGTVPTGYQPPSTISRGHLIPPKIWQILLPHPEKPANVDVESLEDTPSWLAQNPGYNYVLVGQKKADDFINTHFRNDAKVFGAWRALKNPGVKSDLLRYLMLFVEGGVYTDLDTESLKPIDVWVPNKYRNRTRVLIGIEFDQLDGGSWVNIPHKLQFCQWTIAAAPGHPMFMKMAYHAIDILESLATEHGTTLDSLELSDFEVVTSSGPSSWTDVVFDQLKEIDPRLEDVTDLSGMKDTGPRLYGDVLILPIDGFGMGQAHSDSTNDDTIPQTALLRHKFRGSWKSDD